MTSNSFSAPSFVVSDSSHVIINDDNKVRTLFVETSNVAVSTPITEDDSVKISVGKRKFDCLFMKTSLSDFLQYRDYTGCKWKKSLDMLNKISNSLIQLPDFFEVGQLYEYVKSIGLLHSGMHNDASRFVTRRLKSNIYPSGLICYLKNGGSLKYNEHVIGTAVFGYYCGRFKIMLVLPTRIHIVSCEFNPQFAESIPFEINMNDSVIDMGYINDELNDIISYKQSCSSKRKKKTHYKMKDSVNDDRARLKRSLAVKESLYDMVKTKVSDIVASSINYRIEQSLSSVADISAAIHSKVVVPDTAGDVMNCLLSKVENFIMFFIQSMECTTVRGLTISIMRYLKTFDPNKLVVMTIFEQLKGLLSNLTEYESEVSEIKSEYSKSFSLDSILSYADTASETTIGGAKALFKIWKDARHSDTMGRFHTLIHSLLYLGFVPEQWKDEDNNTIRIFDLISYNVQSNYKSCLDLWETMIDSIIYFIDKIYLCCKTGTISSLKYDDETMARLVQRAEMCVTAYTWLQSDKIEVFEYNGFKPFRDNKEWRGEVDTVFAELLKLQNAEMNNMKKSSQVVAHLTVIIRKLTQVIQDYEVYEKRETVQMKPIGVLICGPSAIGKSTVKTLFINAIAKAINISADEKCINIHNGNDKFNSGYKASHTITVFDDLMNETIGTFKGENPLNCIIKFFNNIPADALKADVQEKGKYVFNGHIGIVTTNVPDLKAGYFSNEPLSILRRMEIHVELKLKPGYTDDGNRLDGTKMHMSGINDAWEVDIYEWVDSKSSSITNSAKESFAQRTIHEYTKLKTESRKKIQFADKVINADGVPNTGTGGGSYATPVKKFLYTNINIMQACMIVAKMAQKQRENEKRLIKAMTCCKHTCPIHFCPMKIHDGFELTRSSPIEHFYCQICDKEVNIEDPRKSIDENKECDYYGIKKTKAFQSDDVSFMTSREEGDEHSLLKAYGDHNIDDILADPNLTISEILCDNRFISEPVDEGYLDDLKDRVEQRRVELVCAFKKYVKSLESQLNMDKYLVNLSSASKTWHDDFIALEDLKYDSSKFFQQGEFMYYGICADKLLAMLYEKPKELEEKYKFTIVKWRKIVVDSTHSPFVRLTKLKVAYEAVIQDVFNQNDTRTLTQSFIDTISARRSEVLMLAGGIIAVSASVMACARVIKMMCGAKSTSNEEQKAIVPAPILPTSNNTPIYPPTKPKITDLKIYSQETKTTDVKTIRDKIKQSVGTMIIPTLMLNKDGETVYTRFSALPVGRDYWIIPIHSLKATDYKNSSISYELRFGLNDKSTCRKGFFSHNDVVFLNQVLDKKKKEVSTCATDLALVRLTSVGSAPNLLSFVPMSYEGTPTNSMMIRVNHNVVNDAGKYEDICLEQPICVVSPIEAKAHVSGQSYIGFDYFTTVTRTSKGWCGSPIIDPSGGLVGLHLTGELFREGVSSLTRSGGSAQFLDRYSIERAISYLDLQSEQSIGLICPSIPSSLTAYGSQIQLSEIVYDKHCLVRAEDIGHVKILGCHEKGRSTLRTNIKEFGYSNLVDKHLGFPKIHVVPNNVNLRTRGITMAGEYDRDFNLIKATSSDFDPILLSQCMNDYLADVVSQIDMDVWHNQLAVHDINVAINGVDGLNSVNGLDMSTSAGFYLPGSKKKYVKREGFPLEFSTYSYEFNDNIKSEVSTLESKCKRGERFCHISKCCIKDEPLKEGKNKLRIMNAFDVSTTILFKQYTGSLVRFFYENWHITECCSGINPYKDWPKIAEIMCTFGRGDNILAGDFSNFDKRMSSQMILAAFTILKRLASKGVYTNDELRVFDVLAYECAFPIYDYDGVIILANGSNPSGNPLTVIINSIVNSLYMRMAFKSAYPDKKYRDHIRSLMYGDDSLITVDVDNCPLFCYNFISQFLGGSDIKWTDSFKSADLANRYFDRLEVIDFLKRGFRFDEDLKRWVCPLATASFSKMLNFHSLKTGELSVKNLFLINLETMLTEYAFYGQDAYNSMIARIRELLKELATFDESGMFNGDRYYIPWLERINQLTDYCHLHPHEAALLTFLSDIGSQEFQCRLIYHDVGTTRQRNVCTGSSTSSDTVYPLSVSHSSLKDTIINNDIKLEKPLSVFPCLTHVELNEQQSDTITYYDENSKDVSLISGLDPSYSAGDDNLSIPEYLNRPVRIGSFPWNQLSETRFNIDPWFAFLSNSSVRQKLQHYRHIRGNLMIKVTINGNKFFAGQLLMSYDPLAQSANGTLVEGNDLPADLAYFLGSQRPHVYMDPNTNCGCTMHLPFMYPYDYIDLVDINTLNMGLLRFIDIAYLTALEPDATSANVNIYAYMTDVNVCTPTYFNMGEISQSDEYSDSPISTTATSIAAAAGSLTNVPLIGNAARATQSTFGVVAAIAKLAGFSKPPKIDNYMMAKTTTASSIATFNGVDLSEKLTMDIKQEVDLNPAILGAQKIDELGIPYLCNKECYLKQFSWTPSDPEGAYLGSLPVTPVNYMKIIRDNIDPLIAISPSAMVAMMFKYWRAEMCYRLQLVSTSFHSGRIRVVYDPISPVLQLDRVNTTYSWVLDLKENPEHCMEIGWGAKTKYLKCAAYDEPIFSGSSSLLATEVLPDSSAFNGFLSFFVENPLVVPNGTNTPVRIMAFARAKNARFGYPHGQEFLHYSVTPKIVAYEPQSEERSDGPVETIHSAKLPQVDDFYGGIFFGEEVQSLRCVLKRSTQCYSQTRNNTNTSVTTRGIVIDHFPQMPYPAGSIIASGAQVSTKWFPTPLDVVSKCYVARRGSVRWKIGYEAFGIPPNTMEVGINSEPKYGRVELPAPTTDTLAASLATNRPYELSGAKTYRFTGTFATCEIEVPHYHNARFIPARNYVNYQSLGVGYPFKDTETLTWYIKRASSISAGYEKIDLACSIGEDFYLGMFVNTPLLYDFSYS